MNTIKKINSKISKLYKAFGLDCTELNDALAELKNKGVELASRFRKSELANYTGETLESLSQRFRVADSANNNTPDKLTVIEAVCNELHTPAELWTEAKLVKKSRNAKTDFDSSSEALTSYKNEINLIRSRKTGSIHGSTDPYKKPRRSRKGSSKGSSTACNTAGNNNGNNAGNNGKIIQATPSMLYSFDIETNQYYNYDSWFNDAEIDARFTEGDKETTDFINSVVFDRFNSEECAAKSEMLECVYCVVADIIKSVRGKINPEHTDGKCFQTEVYNIFLESPLVEDLKDVYECSMSMILRMFDKIMQTFFATPNVKVVPYLACSLEYKWRSNTKMQENDKYGHTRNGKFYTETLEDYTKNVQNTDGKFMYSLQDINNYFQALYEKHSRVIKSSSGGKMIIPGVVLIHNLSYEMRNCITSLPWFREMVKEGRTTMLTNNNNWTFKSLEVFAPSANDGDEKTALYFIDTCKLSGQSIAKIGKIHNVPKLDYEYDTIRMKKDLGPVDFEYNKRDTVIALLAFYDAYTQAPETLDTRYSKTHRLPVSQNAIVNAQGHELFPNEFLLHKTSVMGERMNKKTHMLEPAGYKHMSPETYNKVNKAYGGGNVFINPQFILNDFRVNNTYTVSCDYSVHATNRTYPVSYKGDTLTVKAIMSVDLNSAHPSQVNKRLFPASMPEFVDDMDNVNLIKDTILGDCSQLRSMTTLKAVKNNDDEFDTLFPHLRLHNKSNEKRYFSGMATYTFKNLRPRIFKPTAKAVGYTLPTMWYKKVKTEKSGNNTFTTKDVITNEGVNVVQLNNKVVTADVYRITATFEDFATWFLYYDWDDVEFSDMYIWELGLASPYIYRMFDYFGLKKDTYKKIKNTLYTLETVDENSDEWKKANSYLRENLLAKCTDNGHKVVTDSDKAFIEGQIGKVGSSKFFENTLYAVAKAQFNGIYGCSYQSLNRDSDTISLDEDGAICWVENGTEYDDVNGSGVDAMTGSYIALWSRVEISLNTAFLAQSGAVPMYVATDSVKALITDYTDREYIKEISDYVIDDDFKYVRDSEGNKIRKKANKLPFNKQTKACLNYRGNTNELGGMHIEHFYDAICVTQTLKMIAKEGDKTSITFSGCPKETFFREAINGYDEDGPTYDYDKAVDRILERDGYVSMYDPNAKNRSVKGDEDLDGSYELVTTGFVNNNTDDFDGFRMREVNSLLWD